MQKENLKDTLKKQILEKKCSIHPLQTSDILLLDPAVNQHRICSKCIMEKKIVEKMISMIDLLNFDSDAKIPLFPLINDKTFEEMIETENNLDTMCQNIQNYYLNLQNNIEEAISLLIQKDCERAKKEINEWMIQNSKLNNLLSIKDLQEIILSKRSDEDQLHKFIVKRYSQITQDMNPIQESFLKIKDFQGRFSTKQPLIIQSQIINLLQSINLFDYHNYNNNNNKASTQAPQNQKLNSKSIFSQPQTMNQLIDKNNNILQNLMPPSNFQLNSLSISQNNKQDGISILSTVDLIKSNFSMSQKLIINKQANNHLVAQSAINGEVQICYCSFILDRSKKYLVRVSLSQAGQNDSNSLSFGLLPDSTKDQSDLQSHQIQYEESGNFNNISRIFKGGQVAKGNGFPVNRELEALICLEKKILRVRDFPAYTNVCEIDDPNKISSNLPFRFAIRLVRESQIIKITEIMEVNSFEEKM